MKKSIVRLIGISILLSTVFLMACSSSGGGGYSSRSYHSGVGYGGYYGRPWGYHPGYIGGIDPGPGIGGGPVATQLPDMGMPGMGMDMGMGMGMGMDMGGFDF